MTVGRLDETTLRALSPRSVAEWLRMRGFTGRGTYGEFGILFARDADNGLQELVLPTTSQARDFVRRMEELVDDLAAAEDRPSFDILTDLTLAPFDVVRVRSAQADDYGSVPLAAGLDLYREARNLMLAAANAAASPVPRRSWRGRRFEEVTAYLDNVRLGQTQRGSFILTVLSPWDFVPDSPARLDLGDVTFGRRVTRSLAAALAATEVAIRHAVGAGTAAFAEVYRAGVSANLCQALARLAREGEGIDIAIGWSPLRPVDRPAAIHLNREDASILMEAATEMASQEPEPDVMLEGLVAAIAEAPDRFDGAAVLETVIAGSVRKVRMTFGGNERRTIYDAAKEKRWVRVVGELRREGQRLSLLNPRDLALIEATDAE